MVPTLLVLLVLLLILGLIWGGPLFQKIQRRRLKNRLFPSHWATFLEQFFPFYRQLPLSLRERLHGQIQVFLAEKQFIGCGGLQMTEEIELAIAAQACLLLLDEGRECYPRLYSILVYPRAFIVRTAKPIADYGIEEEEGAASGESWGKEGQVVLSWQDVRYDAANWQDGRNVVLHEFAHQLDQEGSSARGVPRLSSQSAYRSWARVFAREYQQLCLQVERGEKTVIDAYGATNPAEFFAVATETFFEKPLPLQRQHPELYEELKRYYQLEPARWHL